ncbi:hypothetical protein B5807_08359 [Epicoccum nigrum]|uniref:RING-type domain-containing protein n=1 Tax=Epicoccum nigrum TaxID=105696 RepID=A0A1Y2LRY2_EPING|nr:hypothetical protein B5807_08359 [Epicoccum nigrum]
MADPGARPAGTRTKNSVMFGNKLVNLIVGQEEEVFTVLEDLICVSPYFRGILQPHRKAIEGDCYICHGALEQIDKELLHCTDLTYCAGPCGNNFHQACVDEWQRHTSEGASIRCPLCLESLNQPREATLPLSTVDAKAFNVYHNWLYDQPHIRIASKIGYMIRAYKLGVDFDEPEFCKDVLKFILKECVDSKVHPGWHDVSIAYAITSESSPLREFLVRMHMQLNNLDKILLKWESYPHEFQKDLAKALMQERGRQ